MRILSGLLVLLATEAALAQSGAEMIVRPWRGDQRGDLRLEVESFLDGETSNRYDYELRRVDLQGRARLDPESPREAAVGFDVSWIDLDTRDPVLPSKLVDISVGAALRIGEIDGWTLRGNLGFGYASDRTFSDSDAWYGIANLGATKKTAGGGSWTIYLNFNGNRSIFPDVPLPGVAWTKAVDSKLRYTIGFPFSSVYWAPDDRWTIDASVFPFVGGKFEAAYRVAPQWRLFAEFDSRSEAWHVEGLPDHRRLLLRRYHAQVGVRWEPIPPIRVKLGFGYAFDREFSIGWDVRNDTDFVSLSDEFYVSLRVDFAF